MKSKFALILLIFNNILIHIYISSAYIPWDSPPILVDIYALVEMKKCEQGNPYSLIYFIRSLNILLRVVVLT